MVSNIIMLRLIITLAACVALTTGELTSGGNNHLAADGKDTGQPEPTGGDDTTCYVCNSKFQDGCDDVFDKDSEYAPKLIKNCRTYFDDLGLQNDKNESAAVIPEPGTKFFCTKTKISFEFHGEHSAEEPRVIRQCSYAPGRYGWAGCYYTANNLYSTTVCKCDDDVNCNSATSIASPLFVFVTGLLMLR